MKAGIITTNWFGRLDKHDNTQTERDSRERINYWLCIAWWLDPSWDPNSPVY